MIVAQVLGVGDNCKRRTNRTGWPAVARRLNKNKDLPHPATLDEDSLPAVVV